MPPFQILHLPYLAYKQALLSLRLQDRLSFSLCSARSRRVVKSIKKSDSWETIMENKEKNNILGILQQLRLEASPEEFAEKVSYSINLEHNFFVEIKIEEVGNQEPFKQRIFFSHVSPEDRQLFPEPIRLGELIITDGRCKFTQMVKTIAHSTSDFQAMKMLCEYFEKYLQLNIGEFHCDGIFTGQKQIEYKRLQFELMTEVCNWLSQKSVDHIVLKGLPHKELEMVLSTVSSKKSYKISSSVLRGGEKFSLRYYDCEKFEMNPAGSFTMDHLGLVDCCYIELRATEISNIDLMNYVSEWIENESPKLKRLVVECPMEVDLDFVIHPLRNMGMVKSYKHVMTHKNGAVQVLRQDGKVATITSSNSRRCSIVLNNVFEMNVL